MYQKRAGRALINLSSHSRGTPGTEQTFATQPFCLAFGCTFRAWRDDLCRNHASTFEQVPRGDDRQTPAPVERRRAERLKHVPRSSTPRRKRKRRPGARKRPRIDGARLAGFFFCALERVDGLGRANLAIRMAVAAGAKLRRCEALAACTSEERERLFIPGNLKSNNRSQCLFKACYAALEGAEGRGSYRRAEAAARAAGARFKRGERVRWTRAIAKDRPPPLPVILASIRRAAA